MLVNGVSVVWMRYAHEALDAQTELGVYSAEANMTAMTTDCYLPRHLSLVHAADSRSSRH